jgi:hypothetical protein
MVSVTGSRCNNHPVIRWACNTPGVAALQRRIDAVRKPLQDFTVGAPTDATATRRCVSNRRPVAGVGTSGADGSKPDQRAGALRFTASSASCSMLR